MSNDVEVGVMEPETTEEPKSKRGGGNLTPEQKQAATLRRDATLLEKYGNVDKAKELYAQADQISPQREKQPTRVNPLTELSEEEQKVLRVHYFETTKGGFAKIAALVSYNKLAEIAGNITK